MTRRTRALALRRREPGPWWPWLALAAATLACCAAYAQTAPKASGTPRRDTPPAAVRPLPETTGRAGVLRPPADIDPKMKVAPPPATSPMPVIHPQTTPQNGTIVIPR